MNIAFLHPLYFFLLLLLIPMIGWYVWRQKTMNAFMQISSLRGFEAIGKSKKIYLRHNRINYIIYAVYLCREFFVKYNHFDLFFN